MKGVDDLLDISAAVSFALRKDSVDAILVLFGVAAGIISTRKLFDLIFRLGQISRKEFLRCYIKSP